MMMTREGLEKLLEADTQIDVKAHFTAVVRRGARAARVVKHSAAGLATFGSAGKAEAEEGTGAI